MSPKTESGQPRSEEAVPYRGEQPYGKLEDLVLPGVPHLDPDERPWVPQADDVGFRPLLLSVSQGHFVNLLRVRKSGIPSRRRQPDRPTP